MATKKKSRKKSSSSAKKIGKTSPEVEKIGPSVTDAGVATIDFDTNSLQDNENTEVQPSAGGGDASGADESSIKNEWITDITGLQPTKKKPEQKKVRIELENIVEYKGKFYRGVQEVGEKLAEKLEELDKQPQEN